MTTTSSVPLKADLRTSAPQHRFAHPRAPLLAGRDHPESSSLNPASFRHALVLLWGLVLSAPALSVGTSGAALGAQGVTTATIRGTVRASASGGAEGALVRIINRSTGYAVETEVRHGRFLVPGLEVGGPYVVSVRRVGFAPQERHGLFLTLGRQLEVDFVLDPLGKQLDTVHVVTQAGSAAFSGSSAGTGTTISDSLLRRMPALNRDMLDFARLVPQVGTRFGALSGGGVGFRFNSYLIDGVTERLLLSNGTLSGIANGKAISIDAVKEYEVVLAPYDVRYGDFAGALVNAVTKSGTNRLHGTAFVYGRNEALARNTPFLRGAPYERSQFGFTVGGPIVRNRGHFFLATEFQRHNQPAIGSYLGQSAASATPVPVSERDVERFATILSSYGLDAGSGGRVIRSNPNTNIFARFDVALPAWRSRAVLRQNYSDAALGMFGRTSASSFPLTSNSWTQTIRRSSSTMQLFTNLPRGILNEFSVSYGAVPQRAAKFTLSPLVHVTVPGVAGANATLVAGPPDNAQGTGSYQRLLEIADHLVFRPGAAHTLSLGTRAEFFSVHNTSTRRQFGWWTFSSLDSLARGEPSSFRIEKDFGSATARLRGTQLSAYAGDLWQASDRLAVTAGIRADLLAFGSRPSYNPAVDSIFGRRTSDFPRARVHWSPRVGFNWDHDADRRARLRGGAGLFVGRPPLAWIIQSLRFDGMGTRTLSCVGGVGVVPRFVPDPLNPPTSCANGLGFADGLVSLVEPRLRMTEMFRASLGYERILPGDIASAIEALYTRTLSDFLFANPNLAGPTRVDRHGRVLYGEINARGRATPSLVSDRFDQLVDLRNHGNGHSLALTARGRKQFSQRSEVNASYTHSRVRDVQSLTFGAAALTYNTWASGRTVSGRHDDLATGVSSYEVPHRVVLAATWAAPWKRWATDFSVYYIGESGFAFAYTDSSAGGLGDLNADGTNANDPIYVPRNAADTSEIMFDGSPEEVLRQQAAFERFIATTPCLRRQRGRIVARNSCRGPFVHTTNASLRQTVPGMGAHSLSLHLEVFNVLNLVDKRWGLVRVPHTVALQHARQTSGSASTSQPVFRFDEKAAWLSAENAESAYQIQLALRYRF